MRPSQLSDHCSLSSPFPGFVFTNWTSIIFSAHLFTCSFGRPLLKTFFSLASSLFNMLMHLTAIKSSIVAFLMRNVRLIPFELTHISTLINPHHPFLPWQVDSIITVRVYSPFTVICSILSYFKIPRYLCLTSSIFLITFSSGRFFPLDFTNFSLFSVITPHFLFQIPSISLH